MEGAMLLYPFNIALNFGLVKDKFSKELWS